MLNRDDIEVTLISLATKQGLSLNGKDLLDIRTVAVVSPPRTILRDTFPATRLSPLLPAFAWWIRVTAGRSSTQNVPRTEQPQPAAWAMFSAPDLQTPLNGIISPSESESSQ